MLDLFDAALLGILDTIRILLRRGFNPNARDARGQTALFYALQGRHNAAILLLLKHGADPNAKFADEKCPLSYAAEHNNTSAVLMLLKFGCNPNTEDGDGRTALLHSSLKGSIESVYFILKYEGDPDVRDAYSMTPLRYASENRQLGITHLLLQNGADPNMRDTNGDTPILCAARNQFPEIVDLLLSHGADPDLANEWGWTTRNLAMRDHNIPILKVLDRPRLRLDPLIKKPGRFSSAQKPPHEPNGDRLNVCRDFLGHVSYFSSRRMLVSLPVHDILYSPKIDEFSRLQSSRRGEDTVLNSTTRWVHFPAINRKWIKDLVKRLCAIDEKTRGECREIEAFIDHTFATNQTSILHARFEGTLQEGRFRDNSCFIIPYIDMDSILHLEGNRLGIRNDGQPAHMNFERMSALQATYNESDLRLATTLDRAYYETLDNIALNKRDQSQVITRAEANPNHIENAMPNSWSQLKSSRKMLMVKQLWLWRLDESSYYSCDID